MAAPTRRHTGPLGFLLLGLLAGALGVIAVVAPPVGFAAALVSFVLASWQYVRGGFLEILINPGDGSDGSGFRYVVAAAEAKGSRRATTNVRHEDGSLEEVTADVRFTTAGAVILGVGDPIELVVHLW